MTDIPEALQDALGATYTIQRELGGGGMSRVFIALEPALGRRVVIKTLPDDDWSPGAAERFRREILTAAQLQHPHIVPVLSAGNGGGIHWFSMPFVEGASLRERLTAGAIPLGEAIAILRDVARALAAAHAKGVVHRDIKPENILLSSGTALVTDFGVAKALSEATRGGASGTQLTGLGMSVGTPAYMAPEQIAADPTLDHRADIYAWGLVAYEVLAGRRPFEGLGGTALAAAQMSTMPDALSKVAPGVPAAASALVMRCLAKDPAARLQQASDLVAAFEHVSGGSPSTSPRGQSWRTAGVAVAAVAVAIALFWAWRARGAGAGDERMIAIAPFRVGGAAPAVHYLREGLADLMTPQLQGVPGVRSPGMRAVLDRWRRAAGSADADLDDAGAMRVATGAGAGQIVLGEIVGTAERLTVSARLLRAADGKEIATARVEGSADSLAALAARLTASLLAVRDGATKERLRTVLSARPDALTAYLAAERLYRSGKYGDAGPLYADAWRVDTTFALVALRLHAGNGWPTWRTVPGPWLDRAWRHRDRLTGIDSLVLIAQAGESYPKPISVRAGLRWFAGIVARYDVADLRYEYGEFLFHHGLDGDLPDAPQRALDEWIRVQALDSSFAPSLEHQAFLWLERGDSAMARRVIARQLTLDSTAEIAVLTRFSVVAILSGPAAGRQSLAAVSPASYPFMGSVMSSDIWVGYEPNLEVVDSLVAVAARQRATLPAGASFERMANDVAWNTGRPSRAVFTRPDTASYLLLADEVVGGLLADGDTAQASRSAALLAARAAAKPSDTVSAPAAAALFFPGLWALHRGDTAAVERARAGLRALRAPPDRPWLAVAPQIYEQLLGAHLAVARHAPDAKARLATVDSTISDTDGTSARLIRHTGNVLLSDLWDRVGEPQRALATALRRTWGPFSNGMLSAPRMRRIGRLAAQLGQRDLAIRAWRTYVAQRAQAEPALRADLADAKAALAKLEAAAR